jgi:hypothetical protein
MLGNKCRLCGAERRIEPNSGNLMWWRGGAILKCFELEREAFVKMATAQGMPVEEWPEKYR